MSRRKQARPIRHLDDEEDQETALDLQITTAPANGTNSSSASEDEASPQTCCNCQTEISSLAEYLEHKKVCNPKYPICDEEPSDPEDLVVSGDEEEMCSDGEKRQEVVRRQRQDAENNNSVEGEEDGETDTDGVPVGFPFPVSGVPGHVTLEALQNTKVAVAQFAATALATNGDNPAALQELAVLQSTLFTLQHQQMMQLSLIQQLQNHLTVQPKEPPTEGASSPPPPPPPPPPLPPCSNSTTTPGVPLPAVLPAQQVPAKPLRIPTPMKTEHSPPSPPTSQSIPPTHKTHPFDHQPLTIPKPPVSLNSSLPPPTQSSAHPPLCSISPSLASSIIKNNDPPPSLNEPNTLEMLQKRAQEVLDNASQGLLANNLADELAFRKNGKNSLSPLSGGRNEPFFKHRCRYCGKVFGSDSALQIHIRSHTGERPFKCNVCGSRFTTKGNLKVHFQRHTSKFPHIKMNPNPVPEHLDKFHPPLLAQMGNQNLPPGIPPHPQHSHPHRPPPHHPFPGSPTFPPPGLPLFRPPLPHDLIPRPPPLLPPLRSHDPSLMKPLLPLSMFTPREDQEMPENLSKPPHRSSSPSEPLKHYKDRSRSRSHSPITKQELIDDEHLQRNSSDESNNRRYSESSLKNEEEDRKPIFDKCESFDDEVINCTEKCENERLSPKREADTKSEIKSESEQEKDRYPSSPQFDECSIDSKYSDDELDDRVRSSSANDKIDQDQPENLSSKSPGARPVSEPSEQRLPIPFPNASSPHSSNSSGSNHFPVPPHPQDIDPSKDPAIYNSLLPRPGSNDNSWESLIEVTKTSETYKLQQLVDNIEHKLTDPNQCVICHRVLSCKSALQMHYRTHTGERPFRCKICGRAFTTKGNLKTHMGVHRLKPPMRVLHQCPVCHKKFTNALVLQQHIRLHTGEPTDLTPEQIHAAEIKDFPHPGSFPHPNFLAHGFPIPGMPSPGLHLGIRPEFDRDSESKDGQHDDDIYDDDDDFSNSSESQQLHFPPFPTSTPSLENQVRTITTMASQLSASELNRSAEDLSINKSPSQMNGVKSPSSPNVASPNDSECRVSPSPPRPQSPINIPRPPSSHPPSSPANSESNSLGALDLTPRSSSLRPSPGPQPPGIFSGLGLIPSAGPTPLMTSALSSLTSSVLTSTAFSPLGMAVGPAVRGNTTCNICFKTFACNSALEIHYRSHTKERPFKCTICDRGFSTKGNMKQHMLTHKIRDMPPHLFENKKSPSFGGPPPPPGSGNEEISDMSNMSNSNSATEDSRPIASSRTDLPESPVKPESNSPPPIKRSPPDNDLPVPKRQPSMPKHLCHVCNKNFSSSSALQIHMRTHTGDKPFRCTVCQKAFTTKGNLKVHMGTHMWSNGASRRGRRMSLDLPPIPMNPKDSEFLQRRPDLFYPYLPTPFLNGVQQKLNEMSAIQSGNHHPGNGLHQPGSKFGSILGLGGFGNPDKPLRPDSRSPPSEKQLSSPPLALSMSNHRGSPPSRGSIIGDEMPKGVWDPYFDRKSNHSEEHIDVSSSPGAHISSSSQRGEGLAA